jgi:hypothetical protein
VLVPLGVLGTFLALGVAPVAAQESNPAEKNVFELEAKTVYCQSGSTHCALSASTIGRQIRRSERVQVQSGQ